jgi:cytochrome c-type biogenesis protein CcmE
MKKHKKLIIGGLVILIALVGLGYAGFMGGGTYYYEVGEFRDKGQSIAGQVTRVSGEVGSDIVTDDVTLRFTLLDMTGREDSLTVIYRGQAPNTFEAGRQAIVEGKLDAAGVFQATSIITKCSSRD